MFPLFFDLTNPLFHPFSGRFRPFFRTPETPISESFPKKSQKRVQNAPPKHGVEHEKSWVRMRRLEAPRQAKEAKKSFGNDIAVDPKRQIRPGKQHLPSYGGTSVPRGANSPSDSQKGCPEGGVVNMDDNSIFA